MAQRSFTSALLAVSALALVALPLSAAGHGWFGGAAAFAAAGGNGKGGGNGNGGGHGKGQGNSSSASASTTASATPAPTPPPSTAAIIHKKSATKVNHGALASQLGALNAAHASAQAFAHASPNSRIGKIKAYAEANAAASASAAAAETAKTTLDNDVSAMATSYGLTTDQINQALAAADPTTALTDLGISATDAATLTGDYSSYQTAEATAATDAQAATDLLNAAANKQPVSAEAKAALDALLVGKIATP